MKNVVLRILLGIIVLAAFALGAWDIKVATTIVYPNPRYITDQ